MSEEIASFLAELRADRAAVKEKEKREAWTKYTSLSIVCIAVLAAVAAQWGGKFSGRSSTNLSEATFNQTKASDQWSFYQAKAIKQSIAEGEMDAAERAGDVRRAAALKTKVGRYDQEKREISAKAREFETQRDQNRDIAARASLLSGKMGLAVSIFQISIAVASICLVMKKKYLWHLSMLLAAAGAAEMVHAWILKGTLGL